MKRLLAVIATLTMLVVMGTAAAAAKTEGEEYTLFDFTNGQSVGYTFNYGGGSGQITPSTDRTFDGKESGYLRFPTAAQNGMAEIDLAIEKQDWSAYKYLNLWVCPLPANGSSFVLRTKGKSHWTGGVALNWEGCWRLISVPLDAANFASSNDFNGITTLVLKCDCAGTGAYPQSTQLFLNRIWLSTTKPEANGYDAIFEDNFDGAAYAGLETDNGIYEVPNVANKGILVAHPDDKSEGKANKCIKMAFASNANNYIRIKTTEEFNKQIASANVIRTSFDLYMEEGLRVIITDKAISHEMLDLVKDNTMKVNGAQISKRWTKDKTTHYSFEYNKSEKTIKISMDGENIGTIQAQDGKDYADLTVYLSQWGNSSFAGNSMYIDNIKVSAVNNDTVFEVDANQNGIYRRVLPAGAQSFKIIKGLFNKDKTFAGLNYFNVSKAASIEDDIIVSASGKNDYDYNVTFFTWSTLESMKPVCPAYDIK